MLVGVTELRLVVAQGNQSGAGRVQLAAAGADGDFRRATVVGGIVVLYGAGDGSGVGKAVAAGLRGADHAGDGDDAPLPQRQVRHLPGVTDAAGGGDDRAAAGVADVGKGVGQHVGDGHGGGGVGAAVGEDQGVGDGLPCVRHIRCNRLGQKEISGGSGQAVDEREAREAAPLGRGCGEDSPLGCCPPRHQEKDQGPSGKQDSNADKRWPEVFHGCLPQT